MTEIVRVAAGDAIRVPQTALVVLIGPSGVGKTTFARRHFLPTQIISSDYCRALVGDDESDQRVSKQAFEVFHTIIDKRLTLGNLSVADSTALRKSSRTDLLAHARTHRVQCIGIIFAPDVETALRHNTQRPRQVGEAVIVSHFDLYKQAAKELANEGFDALYLIDNDATMNGVEVEIGGVRTYQRDSGPFDFIGDVHGCADELETLLAQLGYAPNPNGAFVHPQRRKAVYVGDICDRGPRNPDAWRIVLDMLDADSALWVPGNHDNKFMRHLKGHKVKVAHGLQATLDQFAAMPGEVRVALENRILRQVDGAPPYLILDEGRLVTSHAGIRADMIGKVNNAVQAFCFYGDVTGETDEHGFPVRREWALEYNGAALVVYGHQVHDVPEFVNNTINIDQGCVFGGQLTALRYPERQIVQVPAAREYYARNDHS